MRGPLHYLAAGAALVLAAAGARADEVLLQNGDRLTGEIMSLSSSALVLRSPYGGELSIERRALAGLATDAELTVMLRGEAPQRARLRAAGAGSVTLEGAGGTRVVPLEALAYLNPQPYESGLGTAYSGHAKLSAAYARGNAPSDRVYGDAALSARARAYRYELSGKLDRRVDPALGTSTAWRTGGNYDRFLDTRRFLYARASLEHDRTKDIARRSTIGAGYGAQLIDSERTTLEARAGLDHVQSRRYDADDERYPALGWALKVEHRPRGELRLFHEQEGYWNLDDTARVFLRSKTGARAPLVARLSASLQLNVDWDSRPAPDRRPTDLTLLVGLEYGW